MLPRIHLITDFPHLDRAALDSVIEVVGTGVDAVQVRAKQASARDLVSWTRSLVAVVAPFGTRVVVNDRVDVALASGADGVHLGLDDLPIEAARSLAPAGFLIGATCRDARHARQARDAGADYAGVGPIHPSTTKAGLPDPIGLATLRAAALELPAIAIGGMEATRVSQVMEAGAHGVAVAAAVWRAQDPPRAAKEIVDLVRVA